MSWRCWITGHVRPPLNWRIWLGRWSNQGIHGGMARCPRCDDPVKWTLTEEEYNELARTHK